LRVCQNSTCSEGIMTVDEKNRKWVYVLVGKAGREESFLGLYDEKTMVNFIPAFSTKEDAEDCYLTLPREKGVKYEIQAVHIEELHEHAGKNNFVVTMVDKDGRILKEQSGTS